MCKYDVIKLELNDDKVHTECGFLLDKKYVEDNLSHGKDRCEFCNEVIEYAH